MCVVSVSVVCWQGQTHIARSPAPTYRSVCLSVRLSVCSLYSLSIISSTFLSVVITVLYCLGEDWVQAWYDSVPMSARTGTSVPRRSPHPSLWCCSSPSSSNVLQTWTVSLCLAADLARTAAGLFTMLARQSGTRCQTNLEILTASIVLNGFWKQSPLATTSVTSALEVFF